MSEDKNITPEKLSLKQLCGMLTVGQTRAIIVAIIAVIGGAFGGGMWVNEIRLAHTYNSQLEEMVTPGRHEKEIDGLKQSHAAEIQSQAKQFEEIANENKRYTLQIEFLERCHAYLNARIKGRESELNNDSLDAVEDARKQFVLTLKRMYKDGDRSLQKKDGYEFDESEGSGNHKVIFGNVKPYHIPADVKGDFVDILKF